MIKMDVLLQQLMIGQLAVSTVVLELPPMEMKQEAVTLYARLMPDQINTVVFPSFQMIPIHNLVEKAIPTLKSLLIIQLHKEQSMLESVFSSHVLVVVTGPTIQSPMTNTMSWHRVKNVHSHVMIVCSTDHTLCQNHMHTGNHSLVMATKVYWMTTTGNITGHRCQLVNQNSVSIHPMVNG